MSLSTQQSRPIILAFFGCVVFYAAGMKAVSQVPTTAQEEANAATPAFEVASVRLLPASKRGNTELGPYGTPRFSFRNASLVNLLQLAFNTGDFVGAPKGIGEAYFDVEARTQNGVPLTYDTLKPQLQQLLRQRFGLVAYMTQSESSGFTLVVSKGGPKLSAAKSESGAQAYILPDQLQMKGAPMETFAGILAKVVRRPVADGTDLHGKFDIALHFAPEDSTTSEYPDIFSALKEQLGLELMKHPVTTNKLVIQHLDLSPTDN